jgi:nucleotide-binding universal stress UspA family protein
MSQTLLLAYDGSPSSESALRFATELARALHADLLLLAVVALPAAGDDVEMEALIETGTEAGERKLQAASRQAEAAGVQARFEVAVGHPADQIVDRAEQHGITHIVMGHHSKSAPARWLLGSVAKQVIDRARCTVTVVRE